MNPLIQIFLIVGIWAIFTMLGLIVYVLGSIVEAILADSREKKR